MEDQGSISNRNIVAVCIVSQMTHNASLRAAYDCLMTFCIEMLEQTRQGTRHTVHLGKEVFCQAFADRFSMTSTSKTQP